MKSAASAGSIAARPRATIWREDILPPRSCGAGMSISSEETDARTRAIPTPIIATLLICFHKGPRMDSRQHRAFYPSHRLARQTTSLRLWSVGAQKQFRLWIQAEQRQDNHAAARMAGQRRGLRSDTDIVDVQPVEEEHVGRCVYAKQMEKTWTNRNKTWAAGIPAISPGTVRWDRY